jgi:hypothetical protein
VVLVDGTHSAAPLSFVGNAFELASMGTSVVIVIPTFLDAYGAWLTLDLSNVTIGSLILRHTYNYGEWTGILMLSSALIEVGNDSNLIINNVTFVPGDQSVTYTNPILLGMGSGSSVDIRYSVFINMSLTRVSLLHSYENPKFYLTNISFRYGEHFFSIFIFLSNISSSDFSDGAIYSTDSFPYNYHFAFQNCTFEGIVSNATAGGVIAVYPQSTNLSIDLCTFTDITLLNLIIYGGYIYVAQNPGEIHITNSEFYISVVFYIFFFFVFFLFLFFVYFFFSFRRRRTVELFT